MIWTGLSESLVRRNSALTYSSPITRAAGGRYFRWLRNSRRYNGIGGRTVRLGGKGFKVLGETFASAREVSRIVTMTTNRGRSAA
jgi:hypothetical protein